MVVLIFVKISYENWWLGFYRIWFLRVNGVKIMSGCGWNLKKKKKDEKNLGASPLEDRKTYWNGINQNITYPLN